MKTTAEWKEELIQNAWTGMDAVIDRMLRETWQSATKAQIRRDKFKMLGHTMSMQVSESGDELVNFPGDPT